MRAFGFLLLFSAAAVAQYASEENDVNGGKLEENGGHIEDEISGFNIDRTITRTGHDFVRYMSEYRNLHYPDSEYNLTIHERPSARWGNLIWITYNNKTVFRRFISPSTNDIRRLAEEASKHIHEIVLQEKIRSALTDHFDLGKDEF
ncbi:curli production assembly/transport protein CsgE [Microbulbifer thermotolerans]|uniref:Curli production assembly/transport component CsgE n=1 Tax=Microbulbifer thermotolerans TaxID=252514 RepID=A0A143HJB2_MICTH|nr:curli production assembly/transport protein CsgE [Microbulbifer thermotolerans]AMX01805.1 curli assembly protein CsgE [Microbulbifer thermotolerans]